MFIKFRRYVSKSGFLLMREKINSQILVMNFFGGGGGGEVMIMSSISGLFMNNSE